MANISRLTLLAAAGLCWLGCSAPGGKDLYARLQDEDPSVRIAAIRQAGDTKDAASLPYLVDRLSDSQDDVRFFAGLAIERITGKTMCWKYYEPAAERELAVQRWRQWLLAGGKDATTAQEATSRQ